MTINSPIESPHPVDVEFGFKKLNKRQQRILDLLPSVGSQTTVSKKSVSMFDLSAMTASTDNEFAMFTKGSKRLIIRGGVTTTTIDVKTAEKILREGYKWSGHTHVGRKKADLTPSGKYGDMDVLKFLNQNRSLIYNSVGDFEVFYLKD